ncbi:MAG: cell division protein FtsA [Bulleidia sp.]
MSDKQIFAALEVADHEVRLIVGEFFNTRFNVIKVERIPCNGLSYNKVTDADAISKAIRTAADNVSKMVGASIKKVILAMPSYRMKRYSVRSTVDIEGIDGVVTIQDVRNAISKAEQMKINREYALIQTVCVRYIVNGIATRRIPVGERCSQLSVDIDLLCADRKLSYDLVMAVEKSGISVLDIFPDVYACAKEAALFERAVNQQLILLKVERETTTLTLLKKGRINTSLISPFGIGSIVGPVVDQYGIRSETAVELLKYSCQLDKEKFSKNPVHIWADGDETHTINEAQLVGCVKKNIDSWISAIEKTCTPILQAEPTAVIITGEGGEMQGFDSLLSRRLGVECQNYIPETLGARNAGLTACLGLFYAYQDKLPISGYIDDSLDMDAFVKAVSYRSRRKSDSDTKEDTLTSKLKGLFLEGKM